MRRERLQQIRNVLGSCSLEADHTPTMYDEMDGHIRKLELALSSIVEELEDRYDGAPDSGTQWMAVLIRLAKEAKGEL
jgi:hypothetical protein